MDSIVGSIAPGRYADVVLLSSVKDVAIKYVFANGQLAAKDGKYLLQVPKIDWPTWATHTINIGRKLTAKDFEILAPAGKTTVTAAIQAPLYTDPEQKTATLKSSTASSNGTSSMTSSRSRSSIATRARRSSARCSGPASGRNAGFGHRDLCFPRPPQHHRRWQQRRGDGHCGESHR